MVVVCRMKINGAVTAVKIVWVFLAMNGATPVQAADVPDHVMMFLLVQDVAGSTERDLTHQL